MDSQEGSKNAFAVGSKFDHLSPDHSSSLQKKVFYEILFVNPFGVEYGKILIFHQLFYLLGTNKLWKNAICTGL